MSGGAYLFVNQYKNFVAQDLVVATTPAGPLAQATNYADVRIGGLEVSADSPLVLAHGVLTLRASGAFTRGTITERRQPARWQLARRRARRQHHAGQGAGLGSIDGAQRALVGGVRRADADEGDIA